VATGAVGGIAASQLLGGIADNAVEINGGESEAPIPEIGAYEGGFNILVVGSDAYKDRDSTLNDVNILVHVSADQTSAVAVSIPRDMVVPFPGCINSDNGKRWGVATGLPINNALSYGGEEGGLACVVEVVKNFLGVEIQYAAMIGFDGVANMSNAVGGVTICLTEGVHDKRSGIQLDAGTHTLQGWDALAFLRTRHGIGDGSDLTRISSQQVFLSALLRKLKSEDTLTNVGKLIGLANVAKDNMILSKELAQVPTMVAMAKALSRIPMDRIVFAQYPGSTGGTGIYEGRVQPNNYLGGQLMDAIRDDVPIAVPQAGDGRGAELDPNAPAPTVDPSATPDPNLPEKVVIEGLRGQSAADQTCSVGNG
jgi:LCP family protein required for cell wall assembly